MASKHFYSIALIKNGQAKGRKAKTLRKTFI